MNNFDQTLVLVTPGETARRLSISLRVLERRIAAGEFPPPKRIGRSVRFLVSDIERFAASLASVAFDTDVYGRPQIALDSSGDEGRENQQVRNEDGCWRGNATSASALEKVPMQRVAKRDVELARERARLLEVFEIRRSLAWQWYKPQRLPLP